VSDFPNSTPKIDEIVNGQLAPRESKRCVPLSRQHWSRVRKRLPWLVPSSPPPNLGRQLFVGFTSATMHLNCMARVMQTLRNRKPPFVGCTAVGSEHTKRRITCRGPQKAAPSE